MSPRFWELVHVEPLAGKVVLDVGTGRGRIALALAPHCARVVGIDLDAEAIAEARRRAAEAGIANAEFAVADAEATDYAAHAPDLVVAHLCMSDAIAERAAAALSPGRRFLLVALHTDHWRETGRPSRFAYDQDGLRRSLDRVGFEVETLEVERWVHTFGSVKAGLAAVAGHEERWRADGRWTRWVRYLEEGGRSLTRSHLIAAARRRG